MKSAKLVALGLAAAMTASLAACGASSTPAAGSSSGKSGGNVIRIGVFEPTTGENGGGGFQEVLGMRYANETHKTVKIGDTEYTIELDEVDNKSDKTEAVSAANKLVGDKVSVVLGSYGSGVSIAAGQIFADAKIPAIGASCTNPQVTQGNDYYFRVCFLDPFQGTVLANYAWNSGVTTAYTLAMLGSDYDQGVVYYFKQAVEALGGTVVSEDFPEGTSNFVSYINNAQSAGAGVIMAPVSTNYAQLIIEAASSQGFEGELLGSDTWDNNMVVESAKGKDVSIKVTTFYQEGGAPEFDSGIKEWINANPNALTNNGGNDVVAAVTAMVYDAYFTALEALKAAGSTDASAVLAALPSVSYDGVSGHIAFDEIGDAIRDTAYIKAANTETGAWEFYAVQGVE